jgi:hypothetical protein
MYFAVNLPHCYSAPQKPRMDYPGIEMGSQRLEAGDCPPELWQSLSPLWNNTSVVKSLLALASTVMFGFRSR